MVDKSRSISESLGIIWLAFFLIVSLPLLVFALLLPLLLPYPLIASYTVSIALASVLSFVAVKAIKADLPQSRLARALAIAFSASYLCAITAFALQAKSQGSGVGPQISRVIQALRVQKGIRDRKALAGYDSYALTRDHAAIQLREFFGLPLSTSYRILNYRVRPFRDSELNFLFEEIFVDESYYFKSGNPRPLILDCGSNIGASVLYFKHLYPEARILAFEPDPRTVTILKENISTNGLQDVQVIEKAVSDGEGSITFNLSASSLVSSAFRGDQETIVEVSTVRLSDFVNEPVDFLKLDIEGAEGLVVQDLIEREKLPLIKQMIVEWHHHAELSQMKLGDFLQVLENHNFDYQLTAPSPNRFVPGEFQDVLIFAYQKQSPAPPFISD